MRFASTLLFALATIIGCASDPITLPAVGPSTSSQSRLSGRGSLQVFTALTERNDSGIQYLYPQNYLIYQTNKMVKGVVNSALMEEQPVIVTLPAGEYMIKAPSNGFGWVWVPVVINGGALTEVHLDRRWRPHELAGTTNVAFLPDGSPMGWLASSKWKGSNTFQGLEGRIPNR
jgi:hypothetical protein